MGKEGVKRRRFVIKLKQKRREKISKLKERYRATKTKEEKEKIIEKALRINPHLTEEEFLAGVR